MPYVPARDDRDGFVCDGEWVSRTNEGLRDPHWEALEEWQDRLDIDASFAAVVDVPLDGLKHGSGRPPAGGGLWRWDRRG